MLTQEEIQEFKRLYEEEFGEELTMQEAHDRAVDLFTLFEILFEEPDEAADS